MLPPDTTAPVFSSVLPANNSTVASPGDITGVITDDRAIDRVEIAIKNRANNQWLRPDGSWGAFGWLPTTLASPGSTSSTWTKSWGGTPGIWGYQLRAYDASGNTVARRVPVLHDQLITSRRATVTPSETEHSCVTFTRAGH